MGTMKNLLLLKEKLGTWKAVAVALHKSGRQIKNYRDGITPIGHELAFYIKYLLLNN